MHAEDVDPRVHVNPIVHVYRPLIRQIDGDWIVVA